MKTIRSVAWLRASVVFVCLQSLQVGLLAAIVTLLPSCNDFVVVVVQEAVSRRSWARPTCFHLPAKPRAGLVRIASDPFQ